MNPSTDAWSLMTWNLLLERVPKWHAWPWRLRRSVLEKTARRVDVDLIGLQEVGPVALEMLRTAWAGHDDLSLYSGLPGRSHDTGEFCPIFWRRNLFGKVDGGIFWLSDTPEEPSLSYDWTYPQACTWVRLRRTDGAGEVLVANTHFGHGERTRRESAALAARLLTELAADAPIILFGDFNTPPWDKALTPLAQAGLQRMDKLAGVTAPRTLHLYGVALVAIDIIWVPAQWQVRDVRRFIARDGVVHASDHHGVTASVVPV